MESFDPGGASRKIVRFPLAGFKVEWLSKTSANLEDRVLHCTSQATQDFIAKAAAFALFKEFNGTETSHGIPLPEASHRSKLEKIQDWKGKNVKTLDLPDIGQESCDGRFHQSGRKETKIQNCHSDVGITSANEFLVSVQPYKNASQTSEYAGLLRGVINKSALVSTSSKDCIICTTANSSSTQAAGVLKDGLYFVGSSLLSETNESLSAEIEAPSTPDLKPELKILECKIALRGCMNDAISGKNFPEEQKCSLQPGGGSHGPVLGFEGTYNGQKGASHVMRQYGENLPGKILYRLDETVVRIQKVYRGYRIRKHCLQMQAAALLIQTCYRRWIVQKEYRSFKAIVLRIQARVKAKQLHVQYRHLQRAALLLQQVWRFQGMLRKKNHLKQEELLMEQACTTIQAYARRYKARFMLDKWHRAAAEIQHKWRDYRQKKLKVEEMSKDEAAKLLQSHQQSFCAGRKAKGEHIEFNVQEQAVIVLQAFTRGYLVRKCFSLRRSDTPMCQSVWQLDLKTSNDGDHVPLPVMGMCFNNPKLPEPVNGVFSRREIRISGSSALCDLPGSCTNQASGELGNAHSTKKQVNACMFENADNYHNSEQCRAPFSGVEGKDSAKKADDWNDIPPDHLDECLDTCLAYLRPLPSSLCSGGGNLAHVQMTNENMNSTSATLEQATGIINHLQQQDVPAWLSSEIKDKPKGDICQRQNKEKFEHFAEVFLLHRYIVQQQRRAQDAPPFSCKIPSEVACGKSSGSTLHTCIDAVQPKDKLRNINAKIAGHQDRCTLLNFPSPVTEESSKLVEGGIARVPHDDVVVDIVGLLDHIDKACRAVEPHDKVIHIDENWYQTNTYTTAAAKFCHHTLTSSLSGQLVVPKVRAVFIVVFAMVVYTKILCHGALVWARRSQRNDEKK